MKLLTTVPPRADGTVIVEFPAPNGKTTAYTFSADEDGVMVCDIADEVHIKHLLKQEHFEPADEADFDAAESMLATSRGRRRFNRDVAVQGDGDDDDDDGGGDDGPLAPPAEANTPPKPKAPPKGRARPEGATT